MTVWTTFEYDGNIFRILGTLDRRFPRNGDTIDTTEWEVLIEYPAEKTPAEIDEGWKHEVAEAARERFSVPVIEYWHIALVV